MHSYVKQRPRERASLEDSRVNEHEELFALVPEECRGAGVDGVYDCPNACRYVDVEEHELGPLLREVRKTASRSKVVRMGWRGAHASAVCLAAVSRSSTLCVSCLPPMKPCCESCAHLAMVRQFRKW